MEVRRVRTEQLSLITPDGATVVLATANRAVGSVDSQDELAVSPDGAYLAWTTPGDERLHLRDAAGHERLLPRYARRMRFSPDGKWLAARIEVGRGDWHKLVVWDLATGNVQPLFGSASVDRFEWVPGGLVVAQRDEVVFAPLAGDSRSLFKAAKTEQLERFSAAPNGTRVTVFVETDGKLKLRTLDLEHPDKPHDLGVVPGDRVDNAESSPDGKRLVFSTPTGLYVVDGNSSPRELSGRRDVHSLWFAADGRLAYATSTGTTVLDGKRARRIEAPAPTQMMRFEKGSARVLIASGREARAWDAKTEQQTLLASASPDEDLLGTDRYQGGVVLWTGRAGASPPHRIVRVLRVSRDGATTEVERLDGESATREVASGGATLLASAQGPKPPARTQSVPSDGEVLAATPRGLLVRRARGLALVSPAGTATSLLDESVDAGLTRIGASAQSTHVLVCFRGGSEGARAHPGVLAIDLDAPEHPVELDIDNCWNRALWMSPDGEQVVFSTYGAFALATDDLVVMSAREGGARRSLGEGYTAVVFDGHHRIAFVSHRGVRFVDGKRDELVETDGPVEGLHFAHGGTLRFAVGREVLDWDPAKGTKRVLASIPETQQIFAALAAGDEMLLATVE